LLGGKLNNNNLVEDDETIDFDEIARRANPGLFKDDQDDNQYIGTNYQDFFGDDLNLKSLPNEDPASITNPVVKAADPVKTYDDNDFKETAPEIDQGVKIITLGEDQDEIESDDFTNLSKAFPQKSEEEVVPKADFVTDPIKDELGFDGSDRILNLNDTSLSGEKEEKNLSDQAPKEFTAPIKIEVTQEKEEAIEPEPEPEPISLESQKSEMPPVNDLPVPPAQVEPVPTTINNQPLVDSSQAASLSQEDEPKVDSLVEMVGQVNPPLPQSPIISQTNKQDDLSQLLSEPTVDELIIKKTPSLNNHTPKIQSLESLLDDMTPVSAFSSDPISVSKSETVSIEEDQDLPLQSNLSEDIFSTPKSVLDEALSKINANTDDPSSLIEEFSKDIKDYDLEKLNFHFARINKDQEKDDSKSQKQEEKGHKVITSIKKTDSVAARKAEVVPKKTEVKEEVPVEKVVKKEEVPKKENLIPTSPISPASASAESKKEEVISKDTKKTKASSGKKTNKKSKKGRHLDFTAGIENIIIHNEKSKLRKTIARIISTVLIILFVALLLAVAYWIFTQVKTVIV
jgi:hypothetical protein